jgi:hypothetical protein
MRKTPYTSTSNIGWRTDVFGLATAVRGNTTYPSPLT